MAHLNEQAAWEDGIYQLETTDPVVGGPDGTSNVQAKQLANRTAYLRKRLAQAQASLDAVGVEGQNALWAAMEYALAEAGLVGRELERQRTVRHQEGVFTLYNRGVKRGCGLSKSAAASRNLGLASGLCFMHGREYGVDAEKNAASVPGNSGASAATCSAYLHVADGRVRLSVTSLDEAAPDDGLVLAKLTVPAGNTDATDPYLDSVSVTAVARHEPDWPTAQIDPPYHQQGFERVMAHAGYQLSVDVTGYEGGEPPRVIRRDSDRAANTFRTYLTGSADAVRVRFVAHLMDQ